MSDLAVIWHDLECGAYDIDLPLWRELAGEYGGPILDVGAGSGRVALELARSGHAVTALDRDPRLLGALRVRARGLPVRTVQADARDFTLSERFTLCLVPMQTIQLVGDSAQRVRCLERLRAHLRPRGLIAVAISEALEPFEPVPGLPLPLPDQREVDGVVYSSQPTAVLAEDGAFVLARRREVVEPDGTLRTTEDRTRLDAVSADELEAEGERVGLVAAGRRTVPASPDYVGSTVVTFGG